MKDSEIQKEMQQVFMAMDEAFAESTNRLTGEGLQNEALKKIGRGFFRLNILTPWTKTVQLASFNIGKGLIKENTFQEGLGQVMDSWTATGQVLDSHWTGSDRYPFRTF